MVGATELFDRQVTRNKDKSYSMCSNDMPRLLIRSRLKWWVNPLLAITFLAILVIVVSLLLGSHFFSYFLYRVSAISEKIIAVLYFIPIVAIFALWGLRKVYVYTDRVEVHYPLHLYKNSIITMDDVDAYCVERYWRKSRGSEVEYYRVLLIKGHILWLYVSQENCGNYDDMVSVLKEYFALEQMDVYIKLSKDEEFRLNDGKYVICQDISNEELAKFRKERNRKLNNGETGWNYSPNKYIEITGWKNFLVIAGIAAILLCGVMLYYMYKDNITEKIVVLDRTTKLSDKIYLVVDSVDVDAQGILYSQTASWKDEQDVVNMWAFPILGSKNYWVTIPVHIDMRDLITDEQQRHRLLQIFHEHHTYKVLSNKSLEMKDDKYLSKVAKNTSLFTQIKYDDAEVKMGRILYYDAEYYLKIEDYNTALSQFKQAFADGYPHSAISIGRMYFVGAGVEKDIDKSILWYRKAAEQDFYEDTKADALNELSYAYAAKGHWNEAIASINKAIALRPNDAILYDSKGEHLFMSGDTAQAKAMWKKICELDPELSYTKEKHSKLHELIEDIE